MDKINVYSIKLHIDKEVEIYDSTVKTADKAAEIINLVFDLNNDAVEKLGVIALNHEYKVSGIQMVAVGKVNCVGADYSQIFNPSALHHSKLLILFHNHPSGDPKPSVFDIAFTQDQVAFGDLYGVKIFDHIVIGRDKYHSMRDNRDVSFARPLYKFDISGLFDEHEKNS